MKLENPLNATNQVDKKMQKTNMQKTNKMKQVRISRPCIRLSINKLSMLILLIIVLLINTLLVSSIPVIQLISQTNPLEYGAIQTITLNITINTTNSTNATITQALIEFDEQNHTLQKEGSVYTYYTYIWVPAKKGTNTYKIFAKDSLDQTQTHSNSFTVQDTTPPEITETAPQGTLDYNLIELRAVTNENSTCKYDNIDISYDSMAYTFNGNKLVHTQLRSFSDGEHRLYTRCKDNDNNMGQSHEISFLIDTTPPKITQISPTGTMTQEHISLSLKTNEIATCKWDQINHEYDYLANYFQTTGATQHQHSLTLTEGINTYYVSCQDTIGNQNPVITVNIELNLPPTASIEIEENNTFQALTSGTYEVILLASEPLITAPSLKLHYSNKLINVPLEGSSQTWTGYLLVPEGVGEYVAEFWYEGKDLKGTTGKEITSGKLILLDTINPSKIKSLRLLNKDNKIELSWVYEGEEADHFNIYRSTTGNTDKTDFKTIAEGMMYKDADVINKIGYFYRVSAVDKAGNEGPLSEEEFLMTEKENETTQFKQDPEILAIVNSKIAQLEQTVQNIDIKITQLETTTDQDLLFIINEKEIVSGLKNVKNNIQILIGELKTYRETKITKEGLNTKIQIIDTKTSQYEQGIIKEIKIRNKVQNEQISEENQVQEVIQEYLKDKSLTQLQKDEYYAQVQELQIEVRIVQEIITYEISYEDKASEEVTLIKEKILSSKDLTGIIIQEVIPREVVKLSDITFSKIPPGINGLGANWFLKDLENSELTYTTTINQDLNQLQRIRTVLLYDIDEYLLSLSAKQLGGLEGLDGSEKSDSITGEAVSEKTSSFSLAQTILIPFGILVILTLLVYYFVFLKTEKQYEEEIMTRIDEQESAVLKQVKIPGKTLSSTTSVDRLSGRVYEKSLISGSGSDLGIIFDFVQRAYQGLEHNDLEDASKCYSFALISYSRINLNLKNKIKANFELNTLREKIVDHIKKNIKDVNNGNYIKTKHLYT